MFSSWGGNKTASDWPRLAVWRMDTGIFSSIFLDLLLSSFLIGFLVTLLGTFGTQLEVKMKRCETLAPELLSRGWWRYTPAPVPGLLKRSLAVGGAAALVIAVPSVLIMWCIVQGGTMLGLAFVIFKGLWAVPAAAAVYVVVFLSAISAANFPAEEGGTAGGGGAPTVLTPLTPSHAPVHASGAFAPLSPSAAPAEPQALVLREAWSGGAGPDVA